MRSITHPVTVGFGLANLYLIAMTGPLIAQDHDLVYHLIGAASTIFIPIKVIFTGLYAMAKISMSGNAGQVFPSR